MKRMLKKALPAVCAAAMVLSFASCGDNKVTEEEIEDIVNDINGIVDDMDTDGGSGSSDGGSGAASGEPAVIEFGDVEGFRELNGRIEGMSGQTVTIDGIMDRSGFSGYSIGQKDGDEFIGRRFRVEGFSEGDYPEFGSRVKITGTVVYDEESWVTEIVVQPDGFEVIS